MAYTIKYSSGKILATIADQSYDNITTSLTLVGKNSSAYGQSINQNFVYLLENFASTLEPRSPVPGQLWYNKAAGKMYVYTTSTFRPVGSPIISPTQPLGLVAGDLWIDTTKQQLFWFDGNSLTSSGKNYSDAQGKAGWVVETVVDTDLNEQTVSSLYNNGTLLAVLSEKDIELNNTYCGKNTLYKGLTLNPEIEDIRFDGTATYALGIQGFSPEDFILNYTDSSTTGTVHFLSESSAAFGPNDNLQIHMNNSTPVILGAIPNEKLDFKIVSGAGQTSLITLYGLNESVGIRNTNPQYPLDISGDVRIVGNLIVSGSQTIIETSVLQVKDINIELGIGQTTPSDANVDGAGIIVKGATDHSLIYQSSGVGSWNSTENFNLAVGKTFYIGGSPVLDSENIYVSNAANLVNLGHISTPFGFSPYMNSIIFDGMTLNSNTIVTPVLTDLVIEPGSGVIKLSTGTQILNLGLPTENTNAATKEYVDGEFSIRGYTTRKPYVLTIDVTNFTNVNQDIKEYLDRLLPIDGGIMGPLYSQFDGSVCSVLAVTYSASTSTFNLDLNKSFITVDKNNVSSTESVVQDVAGSVDVTTPMPIPSYQVKVYQVSSATWVFIDDV